MVISNNYINFDNIGPVWDENTQMPPKYQEYARTYAKAVSGSIT